jgi:carbonic anhydrase
MRHADQPSRREFIQRVTVAAGVAGLSGLARLSPLSAADLSRRPKPEVVLEQLLEGNRRFVAGKLLHPRRGPKDFTALAEGQAPLAVIVGCADSRVAPELIFDQGIGDLSSALRETSSAAPAPP